MSELDTLNQQALRAEIVRIGQLLYQRGLIVAGEGNLSVRFGPELLLATPSGGCKGMLSPNDLVVIDLEGNPLSPEQPRVSSEILLHLGIYRVRPDVQAVVHAHPPTAVACTIAGVTIDPTALPEVFVMLGALPTAPFGMFGTQELFDTVAPFIARYNAVLLSHHGALTVGNSLMQAFGRMEQVEQAARIMYMVNQMGGPQPLKPDQLSRLDALRRRLSDSAATGFLPASSDQPGGERPS